MMADALTLVEITMAGWKSRRIWRTAPELNLAKTFRNGKVRNKIIFESYKNPHKEETWSRAVRYKLLMVLTIPLLTTFSTSKFRTSYLPESSSCSAIFSAVARIPPPTELCRITTFVFVIRVFSNYSLLPGEMPEG